jgi:hypothetical protein
LTFDDANNEQQVDYNQTLGVHVTFAKNKIKANASSYFQTGKIADSNLSAYNLSANFLYAITTNFNAGLGVEYLSGTDMDSSQSTIKSFNPLYGTNHKFNGWMDYFYVGNHINSVGLVDVNSTLKYSKNKFSATLMPHIFSSAAPVVNSLGEELGNALGTEVDLALGYNFTKDIQFQMGYSQMFATESMEVLKGGNKDNTNNWAWVMLTVKPNLFSYSKQKE